MGIYVFDTAFLLDELQRDAEDAASTHDFGGDIIPHIVRHGKAVAHRFAASCVRTEREAGSYWRDVGTLDAFFDANLDIVSAATPFATEDGDWPIWTDRLRHPAVRRRHASRTDEPHAWRFGRRDGTVPGAGARGSLIFDGVDIGERSSLDQAVVLPGCRIDPDSRLSRVIVDLGVHIPAGLVVGEDPDLDARRFRRTGTGVCLITQAMIDQLSEEQPGMRSAA
jgi:glucose-1-phosphate adenylyltransferase